ncbi:helix-turn-helix transcriptional regulator [Rhizobium alvei]|uniref:Helix-turn-helix transcriptional regulator n=1 Tax=Rhizobium alvei TaxID=1132659 RepID=A0ABT8YJH5_9HYPH|nr:helix-turn-helix transcriptional regulator [Rhizobium alvei]MDO6963749.1 helix-turn-helix transcriptional regulator [Rhizobium alvei]
MIYCETKPSIAVANIRALAALAGPAEYRLPDLVEILRGYVRFDGIKMTWTDENDRPAAVWHVSPDMQAGTQSLEVFHSRFYNNVESDAVVSSRDLLRGARTVDNCHRYGEGFYDSELYWTIMHPLGFRHALRLVLRGPDRPIGFLTLMRGVGEKAFSSEDEQRLKTVEDLLTHAMARNAMQDESQLVPVSDTALVICGNRGDLLHVSDEARQFLNYIFAPSFSMDVIHRNFAREAKAWLYPLVRHTLMPFAKRTSRPPALYRRNQWGGFSARAYSLSAAETGQTETVGITLTRHIPLALRLMRHPAVHELPRREKDVCLKLAEGISVPEIAASLSMSTHTVLGHVTSLYQRFEVNSREKLMISLLSSH